MLLMNKLSLLNKILFGGIIIGLFIFVWFLAPFVPDKLADVIILLTIVYALYLFISHLRKPKQ